MSEKLDNPLMNGELEEKSKLDEKAAWRLGTMLKMIIDSPDEPLKIKIKARLILSELGLDDNI